MANILAIGDLHMRTSEILPLVDTALEKNEVDTIVMMGDYFDDWYKENYVEVADELSAWVKEKRQQYEVICLIGGHDAPYLVNNPQRFSEQDPEIIDYIATKMYEEMKVQLAYNADGWLFTHAGYVGDGDLPEEYFRPLHKMPHWNSAAFREIGLLNPEKGILWHDWEELISLGSLTYPKQVVGHTPVPWIKAEPKFIEAFINVDTFSVDSDGRVVGDGSLLLLRDGRAEVVYYDAYPSVDYFNMSGNSEIFGAEKLARKNRFGKPNLESDSMEKMFHSGGGNRIIEMEQDLDVEKLFPLLVRLHRAHSDQFELPKGWYDHVLELDQKINALAPDYLIEEVGEVKGELRFYISYLENSPRETKREVDRLIDQAEKASSSICRECGQPGKLSPYDEALCPEHWRE